MIHDGWAPYRKFLWLRVANVHAGFKTDNTLGTAFVIRLNDGGKLEGTGDAWMIGSGSFQIANNASAGVTFSAVNMGDQLLFGNSVRNVTGGGVSSTVINITGGGMVQLASGGTSTSTSGTQFSGS